jgi:site-specific DNA recombinase
MLRDRAYIGDVRYYGGWWVIMRRSSTVPRPTGFRNLLGEKVYKANDLTYAGELITCGHCGRPITGEIVTKKSTGKQYVYYRCTRYTAAGHPRVRLREIEIQVVDFLGKLEQPEPIRDWFRSALRARGRRTTTSRAAPGRGTSSGNWTTCGASRSGC